MSEDDDLWEFVTRDVKPLEGKTVQKTPKKSKPVVKQKPKSPTPETHHPKSISGDGLDRRTDDRLRKGQIPIDAKLDLHGMTQDQAYAALKNFVLKSHSQDKRMLLIITGKGQKNRDPLAPKTGIIKQRAPEWLSEPELKNLILKTHPAKAKHGGDGALYVLLRRKR